VLDLEFESDLGLSPETTLGLSERQTPELLLGTRVATLVSFERSVKSKRADELAWENAREEMSLYGNDSVRTFERSRANILFGRQNVIEVDENTLIIIKTRHTRSDDEISVALLSPALLKKIAGQSVEEQERMLQEATNSQGARVVKIAGGGADGEGVRVGVKTLSDESSAFVSHGGTVTVTGADGTEIILNENMTTTLGPDGILSSPRTAVFAPVLTSPRDGKVYTFQRKVPRVILSWEPVNGAGAYRIVVARDSQFNNIFIDEVLLNNSLVAGNMEPGSYYWRVTAQDADGIESAFSASRTIKTTQDITPPQLTIAFPPDLFVSPEATVDVRGKTDRGARVRVNGHSVPVATDGGFMHTLDVAEGAMLITVEAIDPVGNVEYGMRLITYRGKRSRVAMLSEKP